MGSCDGGHGKANVPADNEKKERGRQSEGEREREGERMAGRRRKRRNDSVRMGSVERRWGWRGWCCSGAGVAEEAMLQRAGSRGGAGDAEAREERVSAAKGVGRVDKSVGARRASRWREPTSAASVGGRGGIGRRRQSEVEGERRDGYGERANE